MQKVTADFGTLMRQAPSTISVYLSAVVRDLDSEFGKGYAAKNPDLVGRMIDACAKDFATSSAYLIGQELIEALNGLANSVDEGLQGLAPQRTYPDSDD